MQPATPHRRQRSRKGSGILETALVVLALIGMTIFVLDLGRILFTEEFITERARSTLRQAAVNAWDAQTVQNYVVYNSATGSGPGLLGLQTSQVSFTTLGTPNTPDYRLQLKVSGVPILTWIPWIAGHYTAPPVVVTMPAQSLGATD